MLKVSRKLNKKYGEACKLCLRSRELILGEKQVCDLKRNEKCYCSMIEQAERIERTTPKGLLAEYIKEHKTDPSHSGAYHLIGSHYNEMTHEELVSIIQAYDYALHPRAIGIPGVDNSIINQIYNLVLQEIPRRYRIAREQNTSLDERKEVLQNKTVRLIEQISRFEEFKEFDDELKRFIISATQSY